MTQKTVLGCGYRCSMCAVPDHSARGGTLSDWAGDGRSRWAAGGQDAAPGSWRHPAPCKQQNIMPIAMWQEKCSSRKRPQKKLPILYICTNRTLLTFPASTSNSRARQASWIRSCWQSWACAILLKLRQGTKLSDHALKGQCHANFVLTETVGV